MAMAAATLWLLVFGVLSAVTGLVVPSLLSVAPLMVATVAKEYLVMPFREVARLFRRS
jgi:hypothetical protein